MEYAIVKPTQKLQSPIDLDSDQLAVVLYDGLKSKLKSISVDDTFKPRVDEAEIDATLAAS